MTDVEQMLAIIAEHDQEAAQLARQVYERRLANGGDVATWIEQLDAAVASLRSGFRKTRLATIARKELARTTQ